MPKKYHKRNSNLKLIKLSTSKHLITRIVISSIDLFFAGLGLAVLIAASVILKDYNFLYNNSAGDSGYNNLSAIKFYILMILGMVWGMYIVTTYLVFNQTPGEKIAGIKIKTRQTLLSRLLGPLLIFDYFFGVDFYETNKRNRGNLYKFVFVLLSWWEYFLLIITIYFLILFS